MEKPVSVGYVQGYTDASEVMSKAIQSAISKNHSNMLNAINEIISILHEQQMMVDDLVDSLDANDVYDEFDDYEFDALMDAIYDGVASGKFTVIVGNK